MKKRMWAVMLIVAMLASVVLGALPVAADEYAVTIRLHYHRSDGNYEGWELWIWDMDGITQLEPPYELVVDEANGDAVCEFQVKTGTSKIGYIVRKEGWTYKDVSYDQHINITGVVSGTVDFYVESGVHTQSSATDIPTRKELEAMGNLVLGDDVLTGIVLLSANYKISYNNEPELDVNMSVLPDHALDPSDFRVYNQDGTVAVSRIRTAGSHAYLTLEEELDVTRGYTLVFQDRSYAVTIPNRYGQESFTDAFTYTGSDLGVTYSHDKTVLRVWAPLSLEMKVNLYSSGDPEAEPAPYAVVSMEKSVKGTWVATLEGDMNGEYYTYSVTTDNSVDVEACDPYARTTGVNGKRAMILDLDSTDPNGWGNDKNPHADENITDAIIYEVHLRDITADPDSGISPANVGKYLGLIERGTTTDDGIPTGLDHIVDLGVTHIQLSPVFDFGSVREDRLDDSPYNWGYDPVNYNVPEGSYSSDPYDGTARVVEMKQMVKGLHDAGLSVIMDVAYSHVYDRNRFCFNQIVPGYFSRDDSNGSGCGNDTASERPMVRKYIVDSVNYWATEYHIDGFRFELVGLIDVDTVNEMMSRVKQTRRDVIFYGEGWQMSTNSKEPMCIQTNADDVPGFGFFNDTFRNTIKGGSFAGVTGGYICGGQSLKADVDRSFFGLPQWLSDPSQSINYLSCHDGYTLYDHLVQAAPDASVEDWRAMNRLGAAFLLTAQGVPYLYAGDEMLRTKPGGQYIDGQYVLDGSFHDNSFNAPDVVNTLKWSDLSRPEYQEMYQYYKGLIAFRKAHPALRLMMGSEVRAAVREYDTYNSEVDGYLITTAEETILVLFNLSYGEADVNLPEGNWNRYVDDRNAGTEVLDSLTDSVSVESFSASVLVLEEAPSQRPPEEEDPDEEETPSDEQKDDEDENDKDEDEGKKNKKKNNDDEDTVSDFELFLDDYLPVITIGGVVLLLLAGGAVVLLLILRRQRDE